MDTDLLPSLAAFGARCAIIAGSGIRSALRARLLQSVPYSALKGWPRTNVPGHGSCLDVCDVAGVPTIVFSGRFHRYEGHPFETTVLPLQLIAQLGITSVILTNAAGGLRTSFRCGDILLPEDVLDLTLAHRAMGHRFPIDSSWRSAVETMALHAGTRTVGGTLAQVLGPSYETRAEIRMLRRVGADAIGMSTVHEAQYAASIGIRPLIITTITNVASDTAAAEIDHAHVVEAAALAAQRINAVVECAVRLAT